MTETKTEGISYSFIKTNRFKTTVISVGFYLPINEFSAANSLAAALMSTGTFEYPDSESFNRKLASLYGAAKSLTISKLGDNEQFRINIAVNDDKYSMNGESTTKDAGELLCDMIFGRYLDGSDYPTDAVMREKRLLIEKIKGEINDKRLYARKRCEEIMCEGEPYGLSSHGTVEQVKNLTDADIKSAISRLIKNAFISVIVIGDKEPTEFKEIFLELLDKSERQYIPFQKDIVKIGEEFKTVTEEMSVEQGKLVLGFRSEQGGADNDTVATFVMTDVFGGGPYSRLFTNVREKRSLCYYCSARAIRRKGLIFVDSGVEAKNIESAKSAILEELSAVKEGKFSQKELDSSKLSLCDTLRSVESDQLALLSWYATRALEEKVLSPQEFCEKVEEITADDIKMAAEGYRLDIVYILKPKEEV